jgi:hypothetical protein
MKQFISDFAVKVSEKKKHNYRGRKTQSDVLMKFISDGSILLAAGFQTSDIIAEHGKTVQ